MLDVAAATALISTSPPEVPVEALRCVQAALSAHPWLLGLPELAFFRSFITESAQQLETGEVERMMRGVRSQIAPGGTPRTNIDGPADDAEVEAALRVRASAIIPRHIASPDPGAPATAPEPSAKEPSAKEPSVHRRQSDFEPPRAMRSYTQYVRLTSGPVILLQGARLSHDLVRADREGAAVYVLMWMVDSLDRCVGGVASWPLKELKEARDEESRSSCPLWNSARQLTSGASTPLMSLRVELWHATKEVLLAAAHVSTASLVTNEALTVPLRLPDDEDEVVTVPTPRASQSTISIMPLTQPLPHKQVFFIRHGESRWNEAQAKKNLAEMAMHVDHPLNETGYAQAHRLQQAVRAALANVESSSPSEAAAVRSLMAAQALWCSPLTRAVQTAIVALQPLLEHTGLPLNLKPNAREKKNFGGRDTIGQSVGAECGTRATSLLKALGTAEEVEAVRAVAHFDVSEVEQQWWVTAAESKEQVQKRMEELLHQIQYSPYEKIVLVGHSHFFRALFQRFLHSDVQRREPELARKLCEDVMPNCGVACCQFDFDRGPRMITAVTPLLAAKTSLETYELVIQRQLEQLAGPVVHLFSARNVPQREGLGRPYARTRLDTLPCAASLAQPSLAQPPSQARRGHRARLIERMHAGTRACGLPTRPASTRAGTRAGRRPRSTSRPTARALPAGSARGARTRIGSRRRRGAGRACRACACGTRRAGSGAPTGSLIRCCTSSCATSSRTSCSRPPRCGCTPRTDAAHRRRAQTPRADAAHRRRAQTPRPSDLPFPQPRVHR